jgi:hypothetical protein
MLSSKFKSMLMKNTVNSYNRSEYIWSDRDLLKFSAIGAVAGFVIGVVVGFEWAWRPVVNVFRPLVG